MGIEDEPQRAKHQYRDGADHESLTRLGQVFAQRHSSRGFTKF